MTTDPKALAAQLRSIGVSQSYASEIAHGQRAPSLKLALRIYDQLGIRLGPIADKEKRDIDTLRRARSMIETRL
jgi:transcriptional regulator with XRE-family HTH domain